MHVENVRSVIEELEREYAILSDKLSEHEKQTDGKTTGEDHRKLMNVSFSHRSNYQHFGPRIERQTERIGTIKSKS